MNAGMWEQAVHGKATTQNALQSGRSRLLLEAVRTLVPWLVAEPS